MAEKYSVTTLAVGSIAPIPLEIIIAFTIPPTQFHTSAEICSVSAGTGSGTLTNWPWLFWSHISEINAAGAALGQQIEILLAGTMREVDGVFASLVQKIDALLVYASPIFAGFRVEITALAARHAVSAMYWDRIFAEAGGLISYGTNGDDQFRQVGVYVGRILNGEKPANLPILRPTKFELVINLKTAKVLGLTVPETLLATADEVFE